MENLKKLEDDMDKIDTTETASLYLTLHFDHQLSDEEYQIINKWFDDWYGKAEEVYGRPFHYMSDRERAEDSVSVYIDFGLVHIDLAMQDLVTNLSGYGLDGVKEEA